MPPKKRVRTADEKEDGSETVTSIKEMKTEILDRVDHNANEMFKQIYGLWDAVEMANKKDTTAEKTFVFKHTFTEVLEMKSGDRIIGVGEHHFGRLWFLSIQRFDDLFHIMVCMQWPEEGGRWLIEMEHDLELVVGESVSRRRKTCKFKGSSRSNALVAESLTLAEMNKIFLVDKNIKVVAHVKILKMDGIVRMKAYDFGESNKEHADVCFKAGNEKFYVQKGYLIHHSPFFRAFFSKNFKEGQQPGCIQEFDRAESAQDLQNYLEVLYGNAKPDEYTVEGILLLNDYYNANNVRTACVDFLIDNPKKTLHKKLELASRYQLQALAEKCVSSITSDEYKALVKNGFMKRASQSVAAALAEKAVTFF